MSFGKATAKAIPERTRTSTISTSVNPERFKAASRSVLRVNRDNRKSRDCKLLRPDENSAGRAVASHHEILASVSECIRLWWLARHVPVWRFVGGRSSFSSLLPPLEGRQRSRRCCQEIGVRRVGPALRRLSQYARHSPPSRPSPARHGIDVQHQPRLRRGETP